MAMNTVTINGLVPMKGYTDGALRHAIQRELDLAGVEAKIMFANSIGGYEVMCAKSDLTHFIQAMEKFESNWGDKL